MTLRRLVTILKSINIYDIAGNELLEVIILMMSILNYTASVTFSFAASKLGPEAGGTVGYAIFNAMSVLTATSAGLIVGDWKTASFKGKKYLYMGLTSMIVGTVIISFGNGLGGS